MNIEQAIKNNKIYILSPHLDDAVLSCGSLLLDLKGKKDITIINVFTRAHNGPYTLSARKFLNDSGGYKDAANLFRERSKEDKNVLSKLKVKTINFNLQEALFRRKIPINLLGKAIPEFSHIYPTYRWHAIKSISPNDLVILKLKNALKSMVETNAVVFAPHGIGGHVDHQITRRVCEDIFENIILYSDFPYNIRTKNYGQVMKGFQKFELKSNISKKDKLLRLYKTQFQSLFPNGKIPKHKEVYFVNKNI